ncbi:MAG TPA: protein translocase subunit SecF [Candidatus Levybacteria bacterium]|nr:protein translocase subunit SecF [Candidatus Levybacteria bacterium]
MNIIKHRKIFYIISAVMLVPGIISFIFNGLHLGIDFTGGSRIELGNVSELSEQELQQTLENVIPVVSIQQTGDNTYLVRTEPISQQQNDEALSVVKSKDIGVRQLSFETVGATIGSETTQKAFLAVVIASLLITGYIAYVFREVSKPLASWKYGTAAVVALLHDVIFVVGVFSILGVLFHVEVDALFITALLTVMGFSVHDSIVVFDRIRENLKREVPLPFDEVVNASLLETLNRSLNTSISTILVLFTLLLFTDGALRWFIFALFIGVLSGTFSSIFNASPLLVTWNNWDQKRKRKIKK